MKTVKTARGNIIDMAALVQKNETTRAVSNFNMNARGDIIDNRGNVEIPKEKISKQYYKDNVPGADTKDVSLKDDNIEEAIEGLEETEELKEVSRTERTREDGSVYYEVEYSDGSMDTVEKKKKSKGK